MISIPKLDWLFLPADMKEELELRYDIHEKDGLLIFNAKKPPQKNLA